MTFGVVAPDPQTADSVAETVRDAGESVAVGSPAAVLDADPEFVVAVGEAAVLDLVAADVSVPLLSVDAGRALASIPRDALGAAVGELAAGEWTAERRAVLSVAVDGERVADALLDAMLVTAEPARISEYGVATGGGERRHTVSKFRADGVVVATPAGSRGYARDAGGPVVSPGTDAVAVVPVAPFAIDPDRWVLDDGAVTLTVERDENDVSLFADGREVCPVSPDDPVTVRATDEVRFASVGVTGPFFA